MKTLLLLALLFVACADEPTEQPEYEQTEQETDQETETEPEPETEQETEPEKEAETEPIVVTETISLEIRGSYSTCVVSIDDVVRETIVIDTSSDWFKRSYIIEQGQSISIVTTDDQGDIVIKGEIVLNGVLFTMANKGVHGYRSSWGFTYQYRDDIDIFWDSLNSNAPNYEFCILNTDSRNYSIAYF
jgi:hypothetical protein